MYRRPPEGVLPYIGNRQKTVVGGKTYNLDLRGDGGYVMAPGSEHRSGRLYEESTPWTAELIAMCPVYDPSWIVPDLTDERGPSRTTTRPAGGENVDLDDEEFLRQFDHIGMPVEERVYQADRYLSKVPGTQKGTGADNDCMALTYKILYSFALPPDLAFECLCEWGVREDQTDDSGGHYPWSPEEIRRKIQYAMRNKDKLHAPGDKLRYAAEWTEEDIDRAVGESAYTAGEEPRHQDKPAKPKYKFARSVPQTSPGRSTLRSGSSRAS